MNAVLDNSTAPIANLDTFALAGNAIFTVENVASGNHFTYRVSACKGNDALFFVSLLTGPNNTNDYTYLGTIRQGQYAHGRKSPFTESSSGTTVFGKVWARRAALPACVRVYHEGRCCRCARVLSTPELVTRGLGPECLKKVGGA